MKKSRMNALWISLAALPVLALVFGSAAINAQEKADSQKPAAEKRERAEPRGRLPNYYNTVVSGEQREKIYEIQQKFRPKLQELQKQLNALRAEQQKEIEAVLTSEQAEKVRVLEAEARARRAQAAAERAAAEAKEAAAAAAKKPAE